MKISESFVLWLLLLGAVSASESCDCLQNQEQTAQLKIELDNLKQQLQVRQVAFSASLLVTGETTIGPLPTDIVLIYKNVITNIGNAYNSNTGVFTAPVRGVYNFEWHVGAVGDGSHASAGWLVKNSENVFMAYGQQNQHFGSTANGVTLLLEVGDVVFVRLAANCKVYDNVNKHNTFSGHMLFPM